MSFGTDSEDDGGLKHITMQRARPPARRMGAKVTANAPLALSNGFNSSDDSDDSSASPTPPPPRERPPRTQPPSSASASPEPPSPQPRATPKYAANTYVYYRRPTDTTSYQAVVLSVDTNVVPFSYVVKFSDASERVTEESYLHETEAGPSPTLTMPTVLSDPEPSTTPTPTTPKNVEEEEEESPELNESMISSTPSTSRKKAEKKEKREKREKKEREKEREERRKAKREERAESPALGVADAKAAVKLAIPAVRNPHPAVARIVPNTKLYGSFLVEKISNRGFRHKRIVVVTSTYVVFAKEDGEIRKWFEISAVDNIFMQEAGGGCKRVLLRLESSNEEPDVVFASREKEDQRNSHATTGEFLKVLEYIHRARNPDRRNVINIQVLNSDVDMKHMIRQNIEKQDVRERRRTLAASTGAPPNMSFGGLSKASRSAAALHKQIAKDEDSDPDDPKLAALPKWKPDSSVKACEECCKNFTLIRRKHHCRACGGVFCASCTTTRLVIAKLGPQPVRACDACKIRIEERL